MDEDITWYADLETPIGGIWIAWRERGVRYLTIAESEAAFVGDFAERFGTPPRRAEALPATLARQILDQINGRRRFAGPIDLDGTPPFQRRVLEVLRGIPRGEVRPYAWLAREAGVPGASRAVGTAMAHNPLPLILPCHRVVRSDGTLGEYSMGGPGIKRKLLELEGLNPAELEDLAARGIRFRGSRNTRIFCLPTCSSRKLAQERYTAYFHSADEAFASGYRPCKLCRPAPPASATANASASS